MRKRIWREYNRKLVRRGSVDFYIDSKVLKIIRNFPKKSRGGRPLEYPPALIQILVVLKIQYNLTYRALEGFAKSIFSKIKKWFKIPSYSTVCKRAKELQESLPKLSSRAPKTILIDSSGIKVYGEGEWKRKIHGVGRPRKWLKMHIVVDEKSQEIVGAELTDCSVGDASMMEELMSKSPKSVKTVKADGAYDGRRCREAIEKRGAMPLIPPRRNGKLGGDDQRDDALRLIEGLGGGIEGRSLWGRLTGYSLRALVETAFSRYKRMFSGRLFSKNFERQRVENHFKWWMLNQMAKS